MAEDLVQMEQWFGQILAGLEPGRRRRAVMGLAQAIRRSQLKRISDNEEPDGAAMAPRLARKDRRGRLRRSAGGKMFRRLRLAAHWKITADADGFELGLANAAIDRVAAEHHFGEVGVVGKSFSGQIIRTRYTQRRLLGFAQADQQLVAETAEAMLDPGAR